MIRKVTKGVVEPVLDSVLFDRIQTNMRAVGERIRNLFAIAFFRWGLLVFLIGFLLGRAMILSEITPFVVPFLASIYVLKREKTAMAALALFAGAFTSVYGNGSFVLASVVFFFLVFKLSEKISVKTTRYLPFIVLSSSFLARVLVLFITEGTITNYAWMMAGVEAGLSFILTMIFLQSVPLITSRRARQPLKNEEIICLIILLASVMTGTIGWVVYDMTVEHVVARYLVLLFAFVGGAAIGSTVGVVTGLILSFASVANLYQMSLLAFSGLLGGLLKEGNKLGVGVGLLIGTMLIGLYGEGGGQIIVTLTESLVAIGVFLLTPKSLISKIARYIPGTVQHSKEQQQYLRKIRDVTAGRVEQFSHLFQTLSSSFSSTDRANESVAEDKETDLFLSNVTEKTCQTCFKKEKCWVTNFNKTYDYLQKIMHETDDKGGINKVFAAEWDKYCVKSDRVIQVTEQEIRQFHANKKLKQQVLESRQLVAEQLLGVSRVMGDFAKEIQKEKEEHHVKEEHILDDLRSVGLEIGHLDIYHLEEGKVEVEMSIPFDGGHGQCEKIIAPVLSDIFNETITVKKEEHSFYPNGYSHVSFSSAKKYVVQSGVSTVAKGGAWVSGDSYSMIELGSGKYAIAISDGMGNGERAHLESNETLHLLQKILQSGIEETVAIKSINSVLSLRTTDEIFSTLDLAMIDLQDATSKFLKIASIPSFIRRGSAVKIVEANNLPMGMIQEFEVDVVSEQLKAGDLLVMMSDGIVDAPRHVENKEVWMKRIISELKTDDPQEAADIILEQVVRASDGKINDDMTIVVAKIKQNTPKWAAIPTYQSKRRSRAVAQ